MSICRQMITGVPHAVINTGTASQSVESSCDGRELSFEGKAELVLEFYHKALYQGTLEGRVSAVRTSAHGQFA
jgi:hypothetical protein